MSIGGVDLKNRIALAPMTRVSATAQGLATERMATYYSVYADGGFRARPDAIEAVYGARWPNFSQGVARRSTAKRLTVARMLSNCAKRRCCSMSGHKTSLGTPGSDRV
jgi:hypothetical protein